MIYGIGHDLVEMSRIQRILQGPLKQKFIHRVLTSYERERNPLSLEYVAGRFAAKEAVAKAWGTGIGKELSFQDIEILPNQKGKPCCNILKSKATDVHIHVSITHQPLWASAFVVIERISQ